MKVWNYIESGFKHTAALCMAWGLTACSLEEGAGTGTASLSWVAPTERFDGTPLSMAEIAGYWVYYGTTEGDYTDRFYIDDGSEMQGTVNAVSGIYYVVVTTYDTEGRESAFSEPVKVRI